MVAGVVVVDMGQELMVLVVLVLEEQEEMAEMLHQRQVLIPDQVAGVENLHMVAAEVAVLG
jgi:hypothetical protein